MAEETVTALSPIILREQPKNNRSAAHATSTSNSAHIAAVLDVAALANPPAAFAAGNRTDHAYTCELQRCI